MKLKIMVLFLFISAPAFSVGPGGGGGGFSIEMDGVTVTRKRLKGLPNAPSGYFMGLGFRQMTANNRIYSMGGIPMGVNYTLDNSNFKPVAVFPAIVDCLCNNINDVKKLAASLAKEPGHFWWGNDVKKNVIVRGSDGKVWSFTFETTATGGFSVGTSGVNGSLIGPLGWESETKMTYLHLSGGDNFSPAMRRPIPDVYQNYEIEYWIQEISLTPLDDGSDGVK